MASFFLWITTALLWASTGLLIRAWWIIRLTSLRSAWTWQLVAWLAWSTVWTVTLVLQATSAAVADHLWYLCAVLQLCPPIAVLGSRRPGVQVWGWFILVPLIAVLGWPAWTELVWKLPGKPLALDRPAVLGFAIVTVMGAGNFLATRFWPTVLAGLIALSLVIVPLTADMPDWPVSRLAGREMAVACLLAAAWATLAGRRRSTRSECGPLDDWNSLWEDFRSLFGFVWASRVAERVNMSAHNERWSTRLQVDGFVRAPAAEGQLTAEETRTRVDFTLRWILRRFVDVEWIDQRIKVFPPPPPDLPLDTAPVAPRK